MREGCQRPVPILAYESGRSGQIRAKEVYLVCLYVNLNLSSHSFTSPRCLDALLQKLSDKGVKRGSFGTSAEFNWAVANFLSDSGHATCQTQICLTTGTAGISFLKKVNKRPNWNLQPVHVVFVHTYTFTVCVQ